jgi:hypothetical protein
LTKGRLVALGAFAALALVLAGSGTGAPPTPRPTAPGGGSVVQHLPAFAWTRVGGADSYEFELAADPGFKSQEADITTANTRATLTKSIPNGTYWWRVRALSKKGAVSGWSGGRALTMRWSSAVRLLWPHQGVTVDFPSTPLTLRWAPVPGAEKYLVAFGTHKDDTPNPNPTDKDCNSLVGGKAVETAATSYTENVTPAIGADGQPKDYYWSVTPLDPERNRGNESSCSSFRWRWPSAAKTNPVKDLRPEPETLDPQFSWEPVPGAAKYQVDINSSQDFSPGSSVCCKQLVAGTSVTPTHVLLDNTYYWRVRAINADGNAGVWSPANPVADGQFEKVFDRAAALGRDSIPNLHLRDNNNPALPAGAATSAPLVVWNPVPGAASYFVEAVPFVLGFCDWTSKSSHWQVQTAVNAWSPLGGQHSGPVPFPSRVSLSTDGGTKLTPGASYCVRVRARADRDEKSNEVAGDFSYLGGGNAPSFTFTNWPGNASRGYLSPSDYHQVLDPVTGSGTVTTTTPYFTWNPRVGTSWYVIVAKDQDFHTIVDYGFTQIPVYAPRRNSRPITYSDETTKYYWAILPAPELNGQQAVGDPLQAGAGAFQKQSVPPTLSGPTFDRGDQLVFSWSAVPDARKYHLQVARDGDFGNVLDDVTTDSVAYTSNKSYPADVKLYWRVRAETEDGVGLVWSAPGQFTRQWPAPALARSALSGDDIPTIQWKPLVGAVLYDLHVEQPNNGSKDFNGLRSAAVTPTRMTGVGNFRWKIRAEFASGSGSPTPGPYSKWHQFTRTIGKPSGLRTLVGARALVFSWASKPGARRYKVVVARTPDFRHSVESTSTDETSYAPELGGGYHGGGLFYWKVAAVDEGGNVGAFSKPHRFRLRLPKK